MYFFTSNMNKNILSSIIHKSHQIEAMFINSKMGKLIEME